MPANLHPDFLTKPIAHRALHDVNDGRPENSRAAILAAIEKGYGIEIDLQLSRDGQAMVFHDEVLDRLTMETGLLNQRSSAELAYIPLRGGSETIPSLTEVLALVAGRTPLLIEIKDQQGQLGPTDGKLEAATAAALAEYKGPVALMSFNPNSVITMARLCPDIPRGLVTSSFDPAEWQPIAPATCERLRGIPDYDHAGASFISHEAADLARPRVAELRNEGAAILCWTIRSAKAEAKAREHAQNITFERYLAKIPA
ncbi:glycerophosphodiester phosphodiesterase family protein [Pseudorhodobacter sp.]|uniref:glycerophosphodiester phosphodiesterase family protein n=1 Tax=Pseudorhodobacter sp. TaxID=1934400 RepID=UPI002647FD69|nr:glycerophosphodiester phosphodiesterase family protein [Pseudorhodobacter sp.]MDN5786550.1 phosphodiesterase [Pseudorhodobacter sp.]